VQLESLAGTAYDNGKRPTNISIRVLGSTLPPAEKKAVLEANSLLEEANTEISRTGMGTPLIPPMIPAALPAHEQRVEQLPDMHSVDSNEHDLKKLARNNSAIFFNKKFDMRRHFADLELRVVVISGMNVPKKDKWGTCDAYAVIKFANKEFKTHVLKVFKTWARDVMREN
jgi:hypothetical protein